MTIEYVETLDQAFGKLAVYQVAHKILGGFLAAPTGLNKEQLQADDERSKVRYESATLLASKLLKRGASGDAG